MKHLFLIIILSNFFLSAFGQMKSDKVTIQQGPEYKDMRKARLADIVAYDETGFYTLKFVNKGLYGFNSEVYIEHFDNDLKLTKSVKLDLSVKRDERHYQGMVYINNDLYFFTSYQDRKQKKLSMYVQTIDKQTLIPNNDMLKISEIDYTGYKNYNAGQYDFKISRDSSKILVYYNLPYNKKGNNKFGYHVFDNVFNELWHQDIELPYEDELFDIERFRVSNDGDVYLLGLMFNEKRKAKRKGKPNYKYHVIAYLDKGQTVKEYPVEVEGKFLTDMQIAVTDDKDIICAGFYSDNGSFSIKGSYYLKISGEDKNLLSESYKDFGVDFLTQNLTQRQSNKVEKRAKKGKNVELFSYDLDNLILRDDGGVVLIGEQYYIKIVTTTTTAPSGSTTTKETYHYYYNDIIAVNISPEGEIDWAKKIPKRQHTVNDGGYFSSYALAVINGKLYFIYNDNPENLAYSGEGRVKPLILKRSIVVLAELNAAGTLTKEALFSKSDVGTICRPKVCEQVSDKEIILFGQRGKHKRFTKIDFK